MALKFVQYKVCLHILSDWIHIKNGENYRTVDIIPT